MEGHSREREQHVQRQRRPREQGASENLKSPPPGMWPVHEGIAVAQWESGLILPRPRDLWQHLKTFLVVMTWAATGILWGIY